MQFSSYSVRVVDQDLEFAAFEAVFLGEERIRRDEAETEGSDHRRRSEFPPFSAVFVRILIK